MEKKKIYLPQCKLFAVDDLTWALLSVGHDCVLSQVEVNFLTYDEEEKNKIVEELKQDQFDCAFSRNFSATLARACFERGIPYFAWTFDTPVQALYLPEAKLETNHIVCFDQEMMKQLAFQNIPHLYYKTLGTNVDRYSALEITEEDVDKYACQVSMVGNLYENNIYQKLVKVVGEPKEIEEIEAWLTQYMGNWKNADAIHHILSDECMEKLQSYNGLDAMEKLHMDNRFYLETQLARELTYRDRVSVLRRVAEKYQMVLYTGSDVTGLDNVECRGKVSYEEEAPKVYHLSRINLNVTLRAIESGVPQRVYDIMAVGGFVMTNYQPEVESLFEVGKEIVVFHDEEEMMEQIEYYLNHEEERLRIAMNGYQKVQERYRYDDAVKQILEYGEKKQILFCIGLNELTEKKDRLPQVLAEKLEIFRENEKQVGLTVKLFPEDIDQWMQVDAALTTEVIEQAGEYMDIAATDQQLLERHVAYYGSASPYAYRFMEKGKPVMIWMD